MVVKPQKYPHFFPFLALKKGGLGQQFIRMVDFFRGRDRRGEHRRLQNNGEQLFPPPKTQPTPGRVMMRKRPLPKAPCYN